MFLCPNKTKRNPFPERRNGQTATPGWIHRSEPAAHRRQGAGFKSSWWNETDCSQGAADGSTASPRTAVMGGAGRKPRPVYILYPAKPFSEDEGQGRTLSDTN